MFHLSLFTSAPKKKLALSGLSALSATSVAQAVVQNCIPHSGPQFLGVSRYASLMPPVIQRVGVDDICNADTCTFR